jgi:hypothetical protein
MIGLALVVGVIFTKLFDQLARVHPLAASACIVSILAGVLYATAPVIRTDIRDNSLLGGSSTLAWNTLNDLRSFHPQLPRDSKLYFADAVQPLSWPHHYGALIKMAYGMDALSILYESNGDRLSPMTTNVLVFGVRDTHLTNETAAYHSNPEPYLKLKQSDLKLGLSATEVIAGRGQYTLRIPSLNNVDVQIAYSVDNDPLEIFSARLDQEGKVSFDVGKGTRAGVYRFWGFTIAGTNEWIRSEGILTVRAEK